MPGFDPTAYEDVDSRLHRFWETHPDGRIATDLIFQDERRFMFRAELYKHEDDEKPKSTGHAEEIVGSSPVNKTSAFENCETSAIGRALANAGFSPRGQRPSREEMAKAQRREQEGAPQQRNGNSRPQRDPVSQARGEAWAEAQKLNMTKDEFARDFEQTAGVSVQEGTAAQFQHYAAQLRESRDTAGAAS